ncbi:MAG TPA: PIG-L family deacetylase [Planctomycetota bacterium]|nr:PIG-L family deacetylase [Planctomycetota bacterium]
MAKSKAKHVVLAAVAHPDDIEFMMAGTLLRLKQAGAEIHMWNLANGSCGTATHDKEEIIRLRWEEAKDAAAIAGATMHPPVADDLAIFYEPSLLSHVAATVRQVKPTIVLTHSPQDYMEDHMNTCRLIVTAVFARGMKNFTTAPQIPTCAGDAALYHAMPHGLRDGLRRAVQPGQYVDVTPVLAKKRQMLAAHKTQKEWLDVSQGMDAYLKEMEMMSRIVGKMSGRFEYAEGWRRHSHLGFGPEDYDPLQELLGDACWTDPKYEKSLG